MFMPVDEVGGSELEKRRLWWLRIAGTYCSGLGVIHLLGLVEALTQARQISSLTWPWWLYATSYMFPLARVVAGIFLVARSLLAVPLISVAVLCAANSLFILPTVWEKQIGFELEYAPIQIVLSRLDFVLLLVIAWAAFRWKTQGLLRSNKTMQPTCEDARG